MCPFSRLVARTRVPRRQGTRPEVAGLQAFLVVHPAEGAGEALGKGRVREQSRLQVRVACALLDREGEGLRDVRAAWKQH